MNLPNNFEYYLSRGIVRKIKPDINKSRFLKKESEKEFRGLSKRINAMGIDEDATSSIIKDCYDILMGLLRAKLFIDGYSASGNFAHEAEVSYLKKLGFLETEIAYLNEIRHNRNAIMYYGRPMNSEYAKKVVEFTKKFYGKLLETLNHN